MIAFDNVGVANKLRGTHARSARRIQLFRNIRKKENIRRGQSNAFCNRQVRRFLSFVAHARIKVAAKERPKITSIASPRNSSIVPWWAMTTRVISDR